MTAPAKIDLPGFGPVPVVERTCPACGDDARLNRRLTGRRWCGFRFPDHLN